MSEIAYSTEEFFEIATWMERHLPRTANDAIAMEASGLFIQEFIRGRSGAYGDLQGELLWGVWPKHPYDDAVARLRAVFDRCFQEGGSFANAVEAAVEAWRERGEGGLLEMKGVQGAASENGVSAAYSDEFLRHAAKTAVRNAAAEAIGGTACAWANDARWSAADFSQVKDLFEFERKRRMEAEGVGASVPLDECGGVGCCLDLAAFLFSTHYNVAPWTPGQKGPFAWSKDSYESFAASMVDEAPDQETMRAFAEENPNALLVSGMNLGFLHPAFFRDPFALALEMVGEGFFEDPEELKQLEKREYLARLTLECCKGTGRENTREYIKTRLGIEI